MYSLCSRDSVDTPTTVTFFSIYNPVIKLSFAFFHLLAEQMYPFKKPRVSEWNQRCKSLTQTDYDETFQSQVLNI